MKLAEKNFFFIACKLLVIALRLLVHPIDLIGITTGSTHIGKFGHRDGSFAGEGSE